MQRFDFASYDSMCYQTHCCRCYANSTACIMSHGSPTHYLSLENHFKIPTMPISAFACSNCTIFCFVPPDLRALALSCFHSHFSNPVLTIPMLLLRYLWTYGPWDTIRITLQHIYWLRYTCPGQYICSSQLCEGD